jgi:hypothetical protein
MWMNFDIEGFNDSFKSFSVSTDDGIFEFSLDSITIEQLDFMASLLENNQVRDCRIRARLANVLWLRKWKDGKYKPKQYAEIAIDSYIGISISYKDWVHGDGCNGWARALTLALQLKDKRRVEFIKQSLLKILNDVADYNDKRLYDVSKLLFKINTSLTETNKF